MRRIHDGNMTGQPIVHMHILHTSKGEMSHTKEGGQPSRRLKVTECPIGIAARNRKCTFIVGPPHALHHIMGLWLFTVE